MAFEDPISLTARMTAAARARESRRPDRLFDDPWAGALAGTEGVALMDELEAVAAPPGKQTARDNPYIAIRTRLFDDFLLAAVRDAAIRQVVPRVSPPNNRSVEAFLCAGRRPSAKRRHICQPALRREPAKTLGNRF